MAKKRTTLVKNFDEIVKSGDMAAFQDVFEKCEMTAKGSALHFYDLTEDMIRWLVNNGLSIDTTNDYGRTPLSFLVGAKSMRSSAFCLLQQSMRKSC